MGILPMIHGLEARATDAGKICHAESFAVHAICDRGSTESSYGGEQFIIKPR